MIKHCLYFLTSCCAILVLSSAQGTLPAKELISNGDFTAGLGSWHISLHTEHRQDTPPNITSYKGKPVCRAEASHKSAGHYYNIQQPIDLVEGKSYRATLEARFREGGEGSASIASWTSETKKNNGLSGKLPLRRSWQQYTIDFTARFIDDVAVPKFIVGFGEAPGVSEIRNISLVPIAETPKKRTTTVEAIPDEPQAVEAPDLLNTFADNPDEAKATFAQPVQLGAWLDGVSRGPQPGLVLLSLEFGKIKLLARQDSLPPAEWQTIGQIVNAGRAKAGAMVRSPQWASMSKEDQYYHMRKILPRVDVTATISGYQDGVIQVGRSEDLYISHKWMKQD